MPDSIQMDQARWERTSAYLRAVFARTDPQHEGIMKRATDAGMPAIDAGPETGRFLQTLATSLRAKLIVEVGTLAGYSAIWLARGLEPGGRVITVEASEKHAAFAEREIKDADLADRIAIRQGRGKEILPVLLKELGAGSVDLVFFDAERSEYLDMLNAAHDLLRPGGMLAIDNALSAKRWTADPVPAGESPDQMDIVNRAVASDARFRSILVPIGNGVLIGTKV